VSSRKVRFQAELDTALETIHRQGQNISKLMEDRKKLRARVEELEGQLRRRPK